MTGEPVIDAEGLYLMPGLVDLHCDAVEKEVQPRPGVRLPLEMAFAEIDRKLAMAGITNMYHGVSFGAGEGLRSTETAIALVRALAKFVTGHTLIHHQVHLRFEMSNYSALEPVADLIKDGCVGLLSFMDHTPGQGQYRNIEVFRQYVRRTYWVTDSQIDRIIQQKTEGRQRVSEQDLLTLAKLAQSRRIPIAGHDPDSQKSVEFARLLGANVLEFPISLEVSRYAIGRGMHVSVGAPNLLIGRSHDGNLSAREAIAEGHADLLCSDYYPAGILQAIFALHNSGLKELPAAVAMGTSGPAQTLHSRPHLGAVEPGLDADLIIVRVEDGRPEVVATIVGGVVVMAAGPLAARLPAHQPDRLTPALASPGAESPRSVITSPVGAIGRFVSSPQADDQITQH
jgi:alpha-D-ribose 1-methylphosphonate 5-triphosphate diphosphatase